MEHLITLLSSNGMDVVLGVLNLLYMFSKRSNFITRLNNDKRQALVKRLTYLAEVFSFEINVIIIILLKLNNFLELGR